MVGSIIGLVRMKYLIKINLISKIGFKNYLVNFSEFGPAEARINNEDHLHIIFYDQYNNKREIFIGEKNWKKEDYEYNIYINTWSRIILPGYNNLAKIIK